ncbi:Cof-type HAD-IIB family hydrolase [Mesobacillus harenae]|uniref:Cof-type HAD-IIB family hydrolase n=1 Tax=Mesobacillus harenae TaxID=2213203 RepID=UPI001580F1E8|nr:Cof-type HAD-IIB family hydrolase [Mesobacillus harenae]
MKNKEIKLVALDLDGTTLNSDGKISEANRRAIKEAEAKGVSVVLSTGRFVATCREHAKSMELDTYLITVNGSEIWDPQGNLIEQNKVGSDQVKWMWELSQTHNTKFWATGTKRVYYGEMPEDILASEWLKFGFTVEDDHVRETIMQELLAKKMFEISNSSPLNIEVNAMGVNKARGLEKVCSLLGIGMENVMAIGDSLNDLAMIKEAGLGIAMGNAQQIVKEAADWETASNNEDGVAKAIEHWIL